MWFRAFSGYPYKFENLKKNIGFGGMWTLPGPLSEKLNFKFVINSKTEVQNVKNCIFTLNFTFSGQLVSLITSRHAFRSSSNF